VRRFRIPGLDGLDECKSCGYMTHDHGWSDSGGDGHMVCPGDWIITGLNREHRPCKPDAFKKTYGKVDGTLPVPPVTEKEDWLESHEFKDLLLKSITRSDAEQIGAWLFSVKQFILKSLEESNE